MDTHDDDSAATGVDPLALVRVRRLAESGEARRIRIANGLSLAEVADPIGASSSALSRWERGERVPRGAKAVRYLRLLDALVRRDTVDDSAA